VKVRFWTPFWQGKWQSYGKIAQPKSAGVVSQTLSVFGTLLAGLIETNV